MGSVLRAYDEDLDRELAVKVMHPGVQSQHQNRILREAQALARLAHPNVVPAPGRARVGVSIRADLGDHSSEEWSPWPSGGGVDCLGPPPKTLRMAPIRGEPMPGRYYGWPYAAVSVSWARSLKPSSANVARIASSRGVACTPKVRTKSPSSSTKGCSHW